MKKVLAYLLPVAFVFMFATVACGGGNAEKVHQKIENKEELTKADYQTMDDYVGDGIEAAKDIVKKAMDNPEKAMKESKKLEDKYKYMDEFIAELEKAQREGKYESKTLKKMEDMTNVFSGF